MLALAPVLVGEVARWLLINPVLASLGFREIPFGSGVPALLTASIGIGLSWYLAKVVYWVGIKFTGKSMDSAQPRTLGEMLRSTDTRFRGRPCTTPALIETRADRRVLLDDRRFELKTALHPDVETQQPVDGTIICITSPCRAPLRDTQSVAGTVWRSSIR